MKLSLLKTTKTNERIPAWYWAKVYEDYDNNKVIWTIIILHGFLKFFRFLYQLWNIYRKRQTWFDKQYIEAYQDGYKNGYIKGVNNKNLETDFTKQIQRKLGIFN